MLVEFQDERRSAVEHRRQDHLREGVRPAAEVRDEDREEAVVALAVAGGADHHAVQVPGEPIGWPFECDVLDRQVPHRHRRHAQTSQVLQQVQVQVRIEDIVGLADDDDRPLNAIEHLATGIDNLATEFRPGGRRVTVGLRDLVPADAQLGEGRRQPRNERVLAAR